MSVKSFDQIESEVDQLVRVWNANPIFSMGDVTLQVLQSLLASFKDSRSAVGDLRTQLTKIVSDMNDQATQLAEIAIRGRMGVRAHFGAESAQYEQVGGTRPSQARSRRPKAAEQPAAS
jgi:hypothetical protein